MSDKTNFKEVIIGALILIVTSLVFKLLTFNSNIINWLFDILLPGFFTLAGAYFGASIAGKSTLEASEKQLGYQKNELLRVEKEKKMKIEELLKRLIKTVNNRLERIEFLTEENASSFEATQSHSMKVELEKEIELLMKTGELLDKLPYEYIPPYIFEFTQEILFCIDEVYSNTFILLTKTGDKDKQAKLILIDLVKIGMEINKLDEMINNQRNNQPSGGHI